MILVVDGPKNKSYLGVMEIDAAILTGGPDGYDNIYSLRNPESIEHALEWLFYRQWNLYARRVEVILNVGDEVIIRARRWDGKWKQI